MSEILFNGLGRRKSSVARVYLRPGSGIFKINRRDAKEYLKSDIYIKDALQPFALTETLNQFDISATVRGGGLSGQAGAIRLGIARALLKTSADYRKNLKPKGMLTQNSKVKERKKPGLKKARKARQFSKR